LLVVALLLPLGCPGEDGAGRSDRWLELLRVVPDNDKTHQAVYLQDVQGWQRASQRNLRGHHLSGISQYSGLVTPEECRQQRGYSWRDVAQTIEAGSPFLEYQAVRGAFDHDAIDQVMRAGPMSHLLSIEHYRDFEYYYWDDKDAARLRLQIARQPIGSPGHRLAVLDDHILWTAGCDGRQEIEDMIDSYTGDLSSLADSEDYRLLARELGNLDTYTAYFTTATQAYSILEELLEREQGWGNLTAERAQEMIAQIEAAPLLKPYSAFATGVGVDGDGPFLAIVILNPDADTARDNAALLQRRLQETQNLTYGVAWSHFFDTVEIDSRGRLTRARVYGDISSFWDEFGVAYPTGYGYQWLLLHE